MDNVGAGDAPCDSCLTERALVHCAQHDARLCLLCDANYHDDARAHRRAPLCDGCYAAPAVARCDGKPLCAACELDAPCQCRRTAASYTGIPNEAEMARILSIDVPPAVTTEDTLVPYDNNTININSYINYYPEMQILASVKRSQEPPQQERKFY
ncbi:hypothetical protein E2562_025028 [Oryza meyeriana var. granulata]|uniref:B box-type domain-containing protein n=1 Tax=Oryza meyeriana var. granulata TaxID=110450 RepID=A0A6G1FC34_9ORYZ|nr:hypothetical protein E2562_025028 [Oryza meyeriana var. granulata]